MEKIWLVMENQSLFVYVIAGVCFVGVLSKLLLQGKLHRLIKASEKMVSTTHRQMRMIRNHYENSLHMDLQVHNIQAFVDKYLLNLRILGVPIRIWDSMVIEAAILSIATGGIGIINTIHKGYGDEVVFSILFATILSCACLLSIENIFRIENSYDRLQANIEDYLENNLKNRLGEPLVSRETRSQRLAAAMRGEATETLSGGREEPRPVEREEMEAASTLEIPEYEVREVSEREVVSGQEAEVVAQVLRNFFSN